VTKREKVAGISQVNAASGVEVMELLLLLPNYQFRDLEETARRLSLTVGQLIRRTVGDFLLRCNPTQSKERQLMGGVGHPLDRLVR
jgi:hypothetical protein